MNPRKWYMRDTAINPWLCHADDGTGDDKGGGGGGGDDDKGGADDKDGNTKGSLADRFKPKEGDDKGAPLDKTPAPAPGAFDMAQLPEAYRGKNADEALGKVFGKLKEYETQAEARGKAPPRAEDYPLKLSEKAQPFFDVENDPVIARARQFALKKGMGTGEFQTTFGPLLEDLAESGLIEAPVDFDKEAEKLGENGAKLFSEAEGYVGRLKAKLSDMSGADKAELENVIGELELHLDTAAGVQLINYMAKLGKETGTGVPGDVQVSGEITADKIREMRKDRKYRTTNKEYDPAYRARVDALAQQLFKS